jgi:acyl-CoA synthetase (AMP-forming)/AMP-acid ligase II
VSSETFRSVGDLVDIGALRSPTRVAVKDRRGGVLRYDQLSSASNRLANGLLAAGMSRGDRLAVWMEDGPDYPLVYLAAAKAGIVVVPINALYRPAEAEYQLEDAGARGLVWSAGLAPRVDELGASATDLLLVSSDGSGPAGTRALQTLVADGADFRPAAPAPDDLLVLAYTSGTTGHPKAAMITHRTALAIARLNTISYRLPAFSVAAITGTLSFPAMVPAHVLSHLYVGGTSIIMGRWDPEALVDTIERERVTFTYLPSPTIRDFTAYAAACRPRWASLESVLHSASRATPEQRAELCDVIGDRFVEGWGMTENSGGLMTATTRADISSPPPGIDIHASVGRAVVEMVVDVRSEDGRSVPRDGESIGELVFRGPAVTAGYWNKPAETASGLRGGWFHSGDLGSIDESGYVYVTERRSDLIVSGGMNVYPGEVERVIMRLAGVRECVVVGAPHERWGQTVVAVVVGSTSVTEQEVLEACRAELASYKKPTRVLFMDDVPRTASLKIRRPAVRDLVASASPSGD